MPRGRPPHNPTPASRRSVETMSGLGIPENEICLVIGVSENTLRKHYRAQLDVGHVKANMKVARNLHRIACGTGREAVTAAIFWMKTRAGWSEHAPPPVAPRIEPLGKKEQTHAESEAAGQGNE